MSAFRALNVESDNESEDEVDNTKEIQIEDALKLYQTALKHHSEGPQSFDKAAEAYKALFESEIFKYTESLSEYRRHELYGDSLEYDNIFQDDFEPSPVQLAGAAESAPNTLPQILHLSYKNHGQFLLEMMQYHVQQHNALPHPQQLKTSSPHILASLQYFGEALDKDDADLDLWSRTASVAALLGSGRITRFCLEAVLDGDEEMLDSILRQPGLQEVFAGQQLKELVQTLQDDLSLMQAPLSTMRRKKLALALKKRLNPYTFAPLPAEVLWGNKLEPMLGRQPGRFALSPAKQDWAGVGEAILHQCMSEQGGFMDLGPGPGITIDMPSIGSTEEDTVASTSDNVSPTEQSIATHPATEVAAQPADQPADTIGLQLAVASPTHADTEMQDHDNEASEKKEADDLAAPEPSAVTRKRSTDSAGLPETADGGRVRSKRLRARESVVDGPTGTDAAAPDLAKHIEDQLWNFSLADKFLFEIMNDLFGKLDVEGLGNPKQLRDVLTSPQTTPPTELQGRPVQAAQDLFTALQTGGSQMAQILLNNETVDLGGMSREAGLNAFLGYAKSGVSQSSTKPILGAERLSKFLQAINSTWASPQEVAFSWLQFLLMPGTFRSVRGKGESTYMQYRWAEDLKRHVVQIIVNLDDYIFQQLQDRVSQLDTRMLRASAQSNVYSFRHWDHCQVEMVQTLFELHLDIYSLIKHPNSGVASLTQTVQKDRLERWAALARDAMQLRSASGFEDVDELALRHIWASIFHLSVCDDVPQEHILYSMEELKVIFKAMGEPSIEVQNNAVMPELSIAAVDRELARISMKDFFLKVFDQDEKDPVAVIESLEPILEPSDLQAEAAALNQAATEQDQADSPSTVAAASVQDQVDPSSPVKEMKKFLDTANVSLRLSLWQRLREAYEAIDYPPKVVSCYLRSIEVIVREFGAPTYGGSPVPDRQFMLLSRMRIIDELMVKILQLIKDDKSAFDCLDYAHLQASMGALCNYLQILMAANFFEDFTRIGHFPIPRYEGCSASTFVGLVNRLHDMQLRTWMLQYFLFKEGILQNAEAFPSPSDDKFEFLRHVHYATGQRGFGHAAGRLFLRLEKEELLQLQDISDTNTRDIEFSQVLYDLYGLKTFTNPAECVEYNATHEVLEKKAASQLLPFLMTQAAKISMKDLPKMELKVAIDKVHGSLGRPKANEDMALNRKVLTSHFKGPVNPMTLFRCLQGVGTLSTKYIPPRGAIAASKGWYFLMGNIALNKFRSQKRLVPGPTEDINIAAAFFMQDLEYSIDRWETWYRLGQAHDSQLEEAVSWTAEKLNNNSIELLHFQRSAIHCYAMAVACAVRDADTSPETVAKVSELYSDFGSRVYASSREPFNMHAFGLRETEQRYYSSHTIFQGVPFPPLRPYTAWKFASVLFKRAFAGNPNKWWNYYMLGKCLWKMLRADEGERENSQPPTFEEVVDPLVAAIDLLPGKKDSRREPILEPHYKLFSIIHKLVRFKYLLDEQRAADILQNTSYAYDIPPPKNNEDWSRYAIAVIKALRSADKSGWHHRMTSRQANIVYEDWDEPFWRANSAKQVLSDSIFTKTMAVQVWKPENERPGRHFVYTTRYTSFFVKLLSQTGDRANLEALARRVRKKPHEFFEHGKLWQELCHTYLKLLRLSGKVPDGHEDAVFKSLGHEEFQARAALVEAWCQSPTSQHPVLDVLRDAIELKRLNNGLMKSLLIDDLICDTYAMLYDTIGPTLGPTPQPEQSPAPSFTQPQPAGPGVLQPPNGTAAMPHHGPPVTQLDGAQEALSRGELPPYSYFHPDPQQQQQQQQAPAIEPTRARAKGVGRRELQRKAEAAVAKPVAPASTPAPAPTTALPLRSPPMTHPSVIISARPTPQKAPSTESPRETEAGPSGLLRVDDETAPQTAENSRPGSVHDSADDESELSELDESQIEEMETVVVKPRFPNLGVHGTE